LPFLHRILGYLAAIESNTATHVLQQADSLAVALLVAAATSELRERLELDATPVLTQMDEKDVHILCYEIKSSTAGDDAKSGHVVLAWMSNAERVSLRPCVALPRVIASGKQAMPVTFRA
jgi:hypothetical protein